MLSTRIYAEVLVYICAICALINLLLVFVILKFKKLRKDSTNQIFLHVNVLQAVIFIWISILGTKRLYFTSDKNKNSDDQMYSVCAFFEAGTYIGFSLCVLFLLFVVDSQLKIYNQDKYEKFVKSYKYIFIVIYILIGALSGASLPFCLYNLMTMFTSIALLVVLIIVMIIIILVDIIHVIRKRKLINYNSSNIGLVIANILLLSLIPCIAALLVAIKIYDDTIKSYILHLSILPFLTPIINLIYVYFCDKTFNLCFKQFFKCQCSNNHSEDVEEQTVNYHIVPNGLKMDEK